MTVAIASGCAITGGIVAMANCERSIAHGTAGAADAPMPVSTPPGSTAFERIPRGA